MTDAQKSVFTELGALVPKCRTALTVPKWVESDQTQTETLRGFNGELAWLDYWNAKASCPDMALVDAPLAVQLEAALPFANSASAGTYKLGLSDTADKTAIRRLYLMAEVFLKGLTVLRS